MAGGRLHREVLIEHGRCRPENGLRGRQASGIACSHHVVSTKDCLFRVKSRLGGNVWRQADIISLGAVEPRSGISLTSRMPPGYDACADIDFGIGLLNLDAHRRVQICTSHLSGGLGVKSAQHRSRPTFLGSLARPLCPHLCIGQPSTTRTRPHSGRRCADGWSATPVRKAHGDGRRCYE